MKNIHGICENAINFEKNRNNGMQYQVFEK